MMASDPSDAALAAVALLSSEPPQPVTTHSASRRSGDRTRET